eukprot:m.109584 g.109584  ORF g.109584 m.109584 type:complete len:130 (-) comp15346_c0_seq33:168-557(-)
MYKTAVLHKTTAKPTSTYLLHVLQLSLQRCKLFCSTGCDIQHGCISQRVRTPRYLATSKPTSAILAMQLASSGDGACCTSISLAFFLNRSSPNVASSSVNVLPNVTNYATSMLDVRWFDTADEPAITSF